MRCLPIGEVELVIAATSYHSTSLLRNTFPTHADWLRPMPNHPSRSYNYHYDDERDPFVYPGTHVLVNNFGLTNIDDLSTVERQITGAAYAKLEQQPIDGNFDLNHLRPSIRLFLKRSMPGPGVFEKKDSYPKGTLFFVQLNS